MSKATKFTDEELTKIKELQSLYNAIVYQAGQLHLDEIHLHERKGQVESSIQEVKKKEQEVISSLTSKYGEGSINLESGEFMSAS